MTMQFITQYIEDKINENENFIRYTFYELRIKNNLDEEEIQQFLEINKNYFENKNYKVYFTGQKFLCENRNLIVKPNELMIAVKQSSK